ncbi:MAG: hypothetical protein IPK15_12945 [Verrucomicrobia bacterium]|nr:hypothetical protein [Verrucomicrobiota bacterium]
MPEMRNVREVNVAFARENAGRNAVRDAVEAIREDGGLVRLAVAIAVPKEAETVRVLLVILDAFPLVLGHVGNTLLDGLYREFLVEPVHVATDVGDTRVQAERLGDVEATLLVDAESDRIREVRFGGGQFDLEPLGHAEAFQCQFAFIGRGLNRRRISALAVRHLSGRQRRGGENSTNKNGPDEGRNE